MNFLKTHKINNLRKINVGNRHEARPEGLGMQGQPRYIKCLKTSFDSGGRYVSTFYPLLVVSIGSRYF